MSSSESEFLQGRLFLFRIAQGIQERSASVKGNYELRWKVERADIFRLCGKYRGEEKEWKQYTRK
ncbi:MAG: hypothetical protein KDD67_17230 [Ignavibacteriae bacterium]|nr:hypothetical protein [Ignavibacteriota bacterium]